LFCSVFSEELSFPSSGIAGKSVLLTEAQIHFAELKEFYPSPLAGGNTRHVIALCCFPLI